MRFYLRFLALFLAAVGLFACKNRESSAFTELSSSRTGIDFNNEITESDSVNLIVNEYSYAGAGVGVGDFNNDDLPDVFFAANQESCKLYINKGDFSFDDITEKAGLKTDFWAMGVSVVDINNDGFDDIYICVSGSKSPARRRNRLYINNKNLTFSEKASEYGLASEDFSTQATFFDYDKDGDLDVYLLNHQLFGNNKNLVVAGDFSGASPSADRLYRNEGIPAGSTHSVFKDVSVAAGIKEDGYGLGVVVSDVNNDNWPDLYIANDYVRNDFLWLNNQDGTFSNVISSATKHHSYSSMGVDAADINNDGTSDITTLDMLPEENETKKMMYGFLNNERYELERRMGNDPQFMRNMLQLNNGVREVNGKREPFFSEIGQLAGVHETNWSWSVLMADFDNDGFKDMHVTNGYGRDMLNNDFLAFKASNYIGQYSTDESKHNKALTEKLREFGNVELKNYLFKNNGDLTFKNLAQTSGLETESLSNGCAYADFDNDGDLDMMVNNINEEAFVLENNTISKDKSAGNFLAVKLVGGPQNINGFGAKVMVYSPGKMQCMEQYPVRGYASTVDKMLHFGLGAATSIDSIRVIWPNDKEQVLAGPKMNSIIRLTEKDAVRNFAVSPTPPYTFEDVTKAMGVDFKHTERFFHDFQFQQLLTQKYSQLGPFISTGDINNDGLDDFFVGGAFKQSGAFFIQQKNGSFIKKELVQGEKNEEDLGSLLFDADQDGDLDLFVTNGSYEFGPTAAYYQPRLYLNDGRANFRLDKTAIAANVSTSAQAVAGADYDGDGDTDLLVGGRVQPGQFPASPQSFLLRNDKGKFVDVTGAVCPELKEAGMITSVFWTDLDSDNRPDLIIAGEWSTIRFFKNSGARLNEITSSTGLQNLSGQWRSLTAADLDKDGDIDFVAGNIGSNNKYRATPETPIKLFVKDFDYNGIVDPILAYHIPNKKGERKLYPAISRDQFASQLPAIKKRFLMYADYSDKTIDEIFTDEDRLGLATLVCEETRSAWIENKGNGKFTAHFLPVEAQLAPVNAIACTDINGDGNPDIIMGGNEYQNEVITGRYDASYGLVLLGDGKGGFTALSPAKSGLILDGDVKDLKLITTVKNKKVLLAAINDSPLKVLSMSK